MQAVANSKKIDPKTPIANSIREQVIQYYVSHPDETQEQIGAHFKRGSNYLHNLLKDSNIVARYTYLKNKIYNKKVTSTIWTAEQIINNVQTRLAKVKTDTAYLKGHELLAKWQGMDKQTINLNQTDTHFTYEIIIKEKQEETNAQNSNDTTP